MLESFTIWLKLYITDSGLAYGLQMFTSVKILKHGQDSKKVYQHKIFI